MSRKEEDAIPPRPEGRGFPLILLNAPGTIDSDYRGPLKVILVNLGEENFSIRTGDRVAQAVLAPVTPFRGVIVETLDETARGEGGFGSTGTSASEKQPA